MAKQKTRTKGPSKSDVIRGILKQNPKAPLDEVQAALKKRGVKASDALVNKIKYGRNRNGAAKRSKQGAKAGSQGSKADAIRTAWNELGATARPRDVITVLASRGVKVTSAQVSTLRKSAGRSRGASSAAAHSVPYDHLLAAKVLAQRLGGIEQARAALDSLARLMEG